MKVKTSTRFLNYLTSAICGVLGWTLYVAPDFFWGPMDGIMAFKFARALAPVPSTHHFDAATRCGLQGVGGFMLAFFVLTPLCDPLQNTFHTKAVLRTKLIFYAWHVVFFWYYGWIAKSNYLLIRPFFRGMALLKAGLTLWLALALRYDSSLPTGPIATSTEAAKRLLGVTGPYLLPWAALFLVAPNELSPMGRLSMYSGDAPFNDLQTCIFAFEGIHLVACVQWMMVNGVQHGTHLNWSHILPPLLYTWSFICGLVDKTGYVDRPKYWALLAVHLVYLVFFTETIRNASNNYKNSQQQREWKLKSTIKKNTNSTLKSINKTKSEPNLKMPSLTDEELYKYQARHEINNMEVM
jgi:hypothetical protein